MLSARDEIEELIKVRNINRANFYEASKFKYEQILRKIYYAFYNTEQKEMCMRLENQNFHSRFATRGETYTYRGTTGDDWEQYVDSLKHILPNPEQKIYIGFPETKHVWLYEGELSETIELLDYGSPIGEYGDFFLAAKDMQWFLYYFDDGEVMIYYQK